MTFERSTGSAGMSASPIASIAANESPKLFHAEPRTTAVEHAVAVRADQCHIFRSHRGGLREFSERSRVVSLDESLAEGPILAREVERADLAAQLFMLGAFHVLVSLEPRFAWCRRDRRSAGYPERLAVWGGRCVGRGGSAWGTARRFLRSLVGLQDSGSNISPAAPEGRARWMSRPEARIGRPGQAGGEPTA